VLKFLSSIFVLFFFYMDITVVLAEGCAPVVSIWKTRFLKCGASLLSVSVNDTSLNVGMLLSFT
jgi:hypothetical protein